MNEFELREDRQRRRGFILIFKQEMEDNNEFAKKALCVLQIPMVDRLLLGFLMIVTSEELRMSIH